MGCSGFEIETPPPSADQRLQSLCGYWRDLARTAGGLPPLQAFDPLHLPKLLPNIWILEVEPETRRFRMRLAGENINAVYGRNIGGQYFSDVFEPSDIGAIIARYTRALTQPAIFRATGAVYAAAGRLSQGERIGLPMIGRSGLTDTLLGATLYGDRLARNAEVLITGDAAQFFPVRTANHKPPEIAGA
jgi:hypothetical protein